ncbi:MAG: LacI family DNA-binding transcriptional regulator [Chitinophagaceae bacterium]
MSRTTIKDIAHVLGINPSTVSRALKDHPDIGKQLKEKIKTIAEELGYSPNQYAVNLRYGKSFTIALVIPEISMYFFPSLIKAIEEAVHKKDYHLMVLHSNDELAREIKNAKICAAVGIDGLLVSLTKETTSTSHFNMLTDNGVPIVYLDKTPVNDETFNLVVFGEGAAYDAMSYLLTGPKPCKRICGIFGDKRLSITKDRLRGFEQALTDHKVKNAEDLIGFANTPDEATAIFKAIYTSKEKPDGVFIMSDELLAGIAIGIKDLDIDVSKDLKAIAISDGYFPKFLPFHIPFIHTSGYQLGLEAAGLLFDLIEKKPVEPGTHFIETPLVV